MINGINTLNDIRQVNPNGYPATYVMNYNYAPTQPYPQDSYGSSTGKKLVGFAAVLATIMGAVFFRKNIGNTMTKHFPQFAKFCSEKFSSIAKPVRELLTKHNENWAVKLLKSSKTKYINGENIVRNHIKEFAKNM